LSFPSSLSPLMYSPGFAFSPLLAVP
jgi:hypothetical protein